ncbi:MAG: dTDP-4-amino-4,6-dideoxygalactose transaminase [Nitrospinae bacterium]|nr:dTDP-4-amino-4,6-dideoxygalactose transaminase [Nitrospinota bacterium]
MPYMAGKELHYISMAQSGGHLSGDGPFTKKCSEWLAERVSCQAAFLTHSCTAALEMAAILAGIQPGDEVIMPSYTFVSTANAFVLRGGVPVFMDIREDTLNMDENKIEAAITPKTKAIVPVHYAGVGCEMDPILEIGKRRGIHVIEDAAQGIMASYKDRPLGGLGSLGCISFHETKNIICGEGGALAVNDPEFIERAEIIREKGTNRSKFFRGQLDKYTWVDIGSSYLPGELMAAFLWGQMEHADEITGKRLAIWSVYHDALESLEKEELLRRPVIPGHCSHNAHMYYILLPDIAKRTRFMARLKERGINTAFHYVPLHSSPAGRRLGRVHGSMVNTDSLSERLVRLPLWIGLDEKLDYVIENVIEAAREG